MNKEQHSHDRVPFVIVRIVMSLAVLFTGVLLIFFTKGDLIKTNEILTAGFLCLAFWMITRIWLLISIVTQFNSTSIYEQQDQGND